MEPGANLESELYSHDRKQNERVKSYFRKYFSSDGQVIVAFHIFRYIFLLLALLFYLLRPFQWLISYRISVIVLIFVIAVLTVYAYERYKGNQKALKLLSLLETVGIALLMFFTGGFPVLLYGMP